MSKNLSWLKKVDQAKSKHPSSELNRAVGKLLIKALISKNKTYKNLGIQFDRSDAWILSQLAGNDSQSPDLYEIEAYFDYLGYEVVIGLEPK